MNNTSADELLVAWVRLSAMLKNHRITKGLMYNEAAVMLEAYLRYLDGGDGLISVKELLEKTRMLKSQLNRTVNSLEDKGLITKVHCEYDKRMLYIRCVEEKLDVFLSVHEQSLVLANRVVSIIGEDDTAAFIRIVNKLSNEKTEY